MADPVLDPDPARPAVAASCPGRAVAVRSSGQREGRECPPPQAAAVDRCPRRAVARDRRDSGTSHGLVPRAMRSVPRLDRGGAAVCAVRARRVHRASPVGAGGPVLVRRRPCEPAYRHPAGPGGRRARFDQERGLRADHPARQGAGRVAEGVAEGPARRAVGVGRRLDRLGPGFHPRGRDTAAARVDQRAFRHARRPGRAPRRSRFTG